MKLNFVYFGSSGHDIQLQFAFQPISWSRVLDWVPDKFEMMREREESLEFWKSQPRLRLGYHHSGPIISSTNLVQG